MIPLDGAVADFAIAGGINTTREGEAEAYKKLFPSRGWRGTSAAASRRTRTGHPSRSATRAPRWFCAVRGSVTPRQGIPRVLSGDNTLCHQLQAESFKHSTERLANDLVRTAKSAEEKLKVIGDRPRQIIRESRHMWDTLSSIKRQANQLAKTLKNVEVQIHDVLAQSKAIFEQSKNITTSQEELIQGQREMEEKVEADIALVQEPYEMDKLKEEVVSI
ncbi:hypothetical protein ACP4OV_007912 [Aristida adscensionis]